MSSSILHLPSTAEINTHDIFLLLFISCSIESILQITKFQKIKPYNGKTKSLNAKLLQLKYQCAHSKNRGPQAFVETSKLERAILPINKELADLQVAKDEQLARLSHISQRVNYILYLAILVLYYGVPVLLLDDVDTEGDADSHIKWYCFPMMMSLTGRLARFGQPNGGVGALFVFLGGQALVEEFAGCIVRIHESQLKQL